MKIIKKLLMIFLLLVICFLVNEAVFGKIYSENVLHGSYRYKAERASSLRENKYILIGGSATQFGFDSQRFEELTGKATVNMAISAGIPMRVYLRAAEVYAKSGDTIIFPMEYGYLAGDYYVVNQDYIDIVCIAPELKGKDPLWANVDYFVGRFLRSFTRVNDCFVIALKKNLGLGSLLYSTAQCVNEYGDYVLHKGLESTYKPAPFELYSELDAEPVKELCLYIEKMRNKGVTVYITYPPANGECIRNRDIAVTAYQQALEEKIGRENIIGTPTDFFFEKEAFFDTFYHLCYDRKTDYVQALYEAMQEGKKF